MPVVAIPVYPRGICLTRLETSTPVCGLSLPSTTMQQPCSYGGTRRCWLVEFLGVSLACAVLGRHCPTSPLPCWQTYQSHIPASKLEVVGEGNTRSHSSKSLLTHCMDSNGAASRAPSQQQSTPPRRGIRVTTGGGQSMESRQELRDTTSARQPASYGRKNPARTQAGNRLPDRPYVEPCPGSPSPRLQREEAGKRERKVPSS